MASCERRFQISVLLNVSLICLVLWRTFQRPSTECFHHDLKVSISEEAVRLKQEQERLHRTIQGIREGIATHSEFAGSILEAEMEMQELKKAWSSLGGLGGLEDQVSAKKAQTVKKEVKEVKKDVNDVVEVNQMDVPGVPVRPPGAPGIEPRCAKLNETRRGCTMAPSKRCKKARKEAIGQLTQCPAEDTWAVDMVQADPQPDKVIVNVGCNKGHDSVVWLQRWDQHDFWNLKTWAGKVSYLGMPVCPRFNYSIPTPLKIESEEGPVAICVEALPATVEGLLWVRDKLKYKDPPGGVGKLEIVHAAAADQAADGQTVRFGAPRLWKGSEIGKMVAANDNVTRLQTVTVPLTTVDRLVHQLNLSKVDILLVDTEGADPLVLKGARETLKSVRYLMFEAHRDFKNTSWRETSLFSVVDYLDKYGFDCYWAGNSGKTYSITHCYESLFEMYGWENVACVRRGDVWWAALEARDPNSPLYMG